MTMKRVIFLALALSLAACKTTDDPDNTRAVGAVAGAVLGAFVGYQFGGGSGQMIMTVLGAVGGGAGGYYAADYIIKRDKKKMKKAAYKGLTTTPVGGTVYWQNQETGSAGSYTVLRAFETADGRQCREFVTNIMGERDTVKNQQTACRIHNGGWEVI
jgi:surface antigen